MATKGKQTLTESEIHDLFVTAVAHINDPDPEDSCVLTPAWDAIATLQRNGDEAVLDICKAFCKSDDSDERAVGAAVLGQLGSSLELLRDERFRLLKEMLDRELSGDVDPEMLASICFAFGHLNDPRAVPAVVPLACHPLSSVRYAVVQALSAQEDPVAIAELIGLSNDEDRDIRDWATFGLGQLIEADNADIREALRSRLTDADPDTRLEAISGLARRKDAGVIPHIVDALDAGEVGAPIFEAVVDLANPIFCRHLAGTKLSGQILPEVVAKSEYLRTKWQQAAAACGCDET